MQQKLTTYDDLACGQRASFTKTITAADISNFIAITADVNPLHVDAGFSARTFFEKPIAHGMLSASLFSHVLGMKLPGIGGIYRSQTLQFHRPVYIGDTLTTSLEITHIDPKNELIEMRGLITNQHGVTVISGTATATLLRGFNENTGDGSN